MKNGLKIKRLKGEEVIPYLSDLAKLRITIFKEYPYLYIGNMEYEMDYLKKYMTCSESIVVVVFDHEKIVGASTAIPLQFETDEFKNPFIENNLDIQNIFYLGESVLLPEYRGRNIYRYFFQEREAAAKEYGSKITAFCAVDRLPDDPRRPQNYVPLDDIWKRFGYQKHPELYAYFKWKEIGEKNESPKKLTFWLKYASNE